MQNRLTLTDLSVKRLPEGTHYDAHTKGLALRVGKQSRTFFVLIKDGKRETLGRYPLLSLAEARKQCARVKAEFVLGKTQPDRTAYDDALNQFLRESEQRNKVRTVKDYRRLLSRHFPFGRTAIAEIGPRDVLRRLQAIAAPSERHHAFVAARRFFTWAYRQHLVDQNPVARIASPGVRNPRERVLSDTELKTLLDVTGASQTSFHAIVRLLILTGQRRSEIGSLRWDWISEGVITFPSSVTKNNRTHVLPIGPLAVQTIKELPRLEDCPYLFPAARQRKETTTTFNGWSKAKEQFDKVAGISDWTLHDLRRTFATALQRLGIRLEVTEAILNHVSGTRSGVVGIYQRHKWEAEMRDAILTYERWLASLRLS